MDNKNKNKLNDFLKGLNEAEIIELRLRMLISGNLEDKRRTLGLTKEKFLKEFKKIGMTKDWLKGAKNYNLMDLAKIENRFEELLIQKNKEKQSVMNFVKWTDSNTQDIKKVNE